MRRKKRRWPTKSKSLKVLLRRKSQRKLQLKKCTHQWRRKRWNQSRKWSQLKKSMLRTKQSRSLLRLSKHPLRKKNLLRKSPQ